MEKYCGKCGASLDRKTGKCPSCDRKTQTGLWKVVVPLLVCFVVGAILLWSKANAPENAATQVVLNQKQTEETKVSCEHQWQEASCMMPKTCTLCGETIGIKGNHMAGEWVVETDESGTRILKTKSCLACGEIVDEAEESMKVEKEYRVLTDTEMPAEAALAFLPIVEQSAELYEQGSYSPQWGSIADIDSDGQLELLMHRSEELSPEEFTKIRTANEIVHVSVYDYENGTLYTRYDKELLRYEPSLYSYAEFAVRDGKYHVVLLSSEGETGDGGRRTNNYQTYDCEKYHRQNTFQEKQLLGRLDSYYFVDYKEATMAEYGVALGRYHGIGDESQRIQPTELRYMLQLAAGIRTEEPEKHDDTFLKEDVRFARYTERIGIGKYLEYAVITGYDEAENLRWTYTTEKYPAGDKLAVWGESQIATEEPYLFSENGTLVALDRTTGKVLWKNSNFGGMLTSYCVEEDGTISCCGYEGPYFFQVSCLGETLRRIDSFGKGYSQAASIEKYKDTFYIDLEWGPGKIRKEAFYDWTADSWEGISEYMEYCTFTLDTTDWTLKTPDGQKMESPCNWKITSSVNWKDNMLMRDAVETHIPLSGYRSSVMGYSVFGSELMRSQIGAVVFHDSLEGVPENSWDASEYQNGSVLAWVTTGTRQDIDEDLYELHIAADGGINGKLACKDLFCGYGNLVSVDFGGCFHTEEAEDMSRMFYACTFLKEIKDLGEIRTDNATTVSEMFSNCINLVSVDLSRFDTSKVTDMSGMFHRCDMLESIDMNCLETNSLTDVSYMLYGCPAAHSVYLGNFNTSKVKSYARFMDDDVLVRGGAWKNIFLDRAITNVGQNRTYEHKWETGCLKVSILSYDHVRVEIQDEKLKGEGINGDYEIAVLLRHIPDSWTGYELSLGYRDQERHGYCYYPYAGSAANGGYDPKSYTWDIEDDIATMDIYASDLIRWNMYEIKEIVIYGVGDPMMVDMR